MTHYDQSLLQPVAALQRELHTANRSNLENMQMLTSIVKNLSKIEMMEDGGESMGKWEADGSYDGGNSGIHYVRGHYSRADGMERGRYSRDGYSGDDRMISKLMEAMSEARTEEERNSIRDLMDRLR